MSLRGLIHVDVFSFSHYLRLSPLTSWQNRRWEPISDRRLFHPGIAVRRSAPTVRFQPRSSDTTVSCRPHSLLEIFRATASSGKASARTAPPEQTARYSFPSRE